MSNEGLSPQQCAAIAARKDDNLVSEIQNTTEAIRNLRDAQPFIAPTETDLDDDLAALQQEAIAERAEAEAQAAEQPAPAPKSREEQIHDAILSNLKGHADTPSVEEIAGWKAEFGNSAVQCISFSEDDVFIFTHITLAQWKQVQEIARSVQGTAAAESIDAKLQEKVLRSAILWPKLSANFFKTCHAGLPSTMYEVILLNSYFLSPAQAMTITTQL